MPITWKIMFLTGIAKKDEIPSSKKRKKLKSRTYSKFAMIHNGEIQNKI
jgi:hypothetical protein